MLFCVLKAIPPWLGVLFVPLGVASGVPVLVLVLVIIVGELDDGVRVEGTLGAGGLVAGFELGLGLGVTASDDVVVRTPLEDILEGERVNVGVGELLGRVGEPDGNPAVTPVWQPEGVTVTVDTMMRVTVVTVVWLVDVAVGNGVTGV